MTLRIHAELTGDAASMVRATKESQAAIAQVGAAAQKVIADAQRAASVGAQIDRMFAPAGAARDRAADIAAYGAELDALRARFNPLFAVSKQYERTLEEIARAERLGAITAMEAAAARERAAASMTPLNAATGGLTRSFADLAKGGIQNASYQIADFATVVAAGGSPTIALAQQLPQLAAGFGVAGAALGALLAVGIPLAAAGWASMSGEGSRLGDVVDELKDALDAYDVAQRAVAQSNEQLVAAYGRSAGEARRLLEIQQEMARVDAVSALRETQQALSEVFGALPGTGTSSNRAAAQSRSNLIGNIADELDIARGAAAQLIPLLAAVAAAPADGGGADAISALRDGIIAATGGVGDMDAETRTLIGSLTDAELAMLAVGSGADGVAGSISSAAAEADRLAAALGRAAAAAAGAVAGSAQALKESEIRLQYKGDPVGEAGALAGVRFDANFEGVDRSGLDPILRDELDAQRDAYIANSEATAGNVKALEAWTAAQRKAAGASGASGGSRGGRGSVDPAAREAERGAKAVERLIASLRAEQDAMHTIDPLQQEMIRLRERMTHATVEQRVTVESLVRANLAEEAAIDAQIGRLDTLRDVGANAFDTITSKMLDGAKAGDILGSVLSGIGDRLMGLGAQGISDVLFGKQGTAGGGVLGSVLSSILPFAQGGVVTSPTMFGFGSGRIGLMGEAGPEAIMPLSSGMVGARVGGRETRLPLTRLGSGDLGVAVTPFARGGVVTPGPLAFAGGGRDGAAAPAAGKLKLEVSLSPDLKASLLDEASSTAELHVERGLKSYDRTLPARVGRIQRDPGYRGSR